jgi:hypothetical protein
LAKCKAFLSEWEIATCSLTLPPECELISGSDFVGPSAIEFWRDARKFERAKAHAVFPDLSDGRSEQLVA